MRRRRLQAGAIVMALVAALAGCAGKGAASRAGPKAGSTASHPAVVAAELSYPEAYSAIYVIDANGRGLRRVSEGNWSTNPSWSPDGSRLCYASGDGAWHLWVVDSDGTDPVRIPRCAHTFESAGAWSPDGRRIAGVGLRVAEPREPGSRFVRSDTWGHYAVCIVSAEGRGEPVWLPPEATEVRPRRSPDGRRVAFEKVRPDGRPRMCVASADGTGLGRIIEPGEESEVKLATPWKSPTCTEDRDWSPDGETAVFYRRRTEGYRTVSEVWTVHRDGTGEKRLTDAGGIAPWGGPPRWSPGVSRIVFQRAAEGWRVSHLWIMDGDGSNQAPLTKGVHYVASPVWSPDSSHIAFVAGFERPPSIDPPDPPGP